MNQEKTTTKIQTFMDLDAWKEGHQLVLMIYAITKQFPKEEMFGLTSQMRRSAVSVTSNIAEGFSRGSYTDKAHFYSISLGSVTELQNQVIIGKDVDYMSLEDYDKLYNQMLKVHRIINGLIKKSKEIQHYS